MHHNAGRQRAYKSSRLIKESKSRVKPFMWRVLREPKNLDTQRLGYYASYGSIKRKSAISL